MHTRSQSKGPDVPVSEDNAQASTSAAGLEMPRHSTEGSATSQEDPNQASATASIKQAIVEAMAVVLSNQTQILARTIETGFQNMSLQANSQRISIDGAQDTNLNRPTVQYVEQQAFEQLLRTAPVDPTPTSGLAPCTKRTLFFDRHLRNL
ncbi:hypothetical protein ACLKA7_000070 [Drosophila subpalustris]